MESIGPPIEAVAYPHAENDPTDLKRKVFLTHESITNNFLKERLECAERFVWLVGAVGSTGALIWTIGAFINRAHP